MLEKDYKDIIIGIKNDVANTQYKVIVSVNEQLINLYFRLGKVFSENSSYGNKFIDNVSIDLRLEFPNIKGFSIRNLKNMKKLYEEYKDNPIMQQAVAQLPWGHNVVLIEKIKKVLLELGNGFSFVGNQYKLTIDDKDYYIDLLFYHLKLRCYIVVELKAGKFKPENIGKLNFYLSALDDMLKSENDNLTIGLILCQEKDKITAEYSLKDINKPIGVSSYEISKVLPKDIMDKLPTEEDINLHIDIEELLIIKMRK